MPFFVSKQGQLMEDLWSSRLALPDYRAKTKQALNSIRVQAPS